MTDMIEKLAIAISGAPFPSKASLAKARAALEALRTPTYEMIEAGVNRGRRDDLYTDVEHCFQVMVDKALGRVDLPVGEEQQP